MLVLEVFPDYRMFMFLNTLMEVKQVKCDYMVESVKS